MHAKIDNVKTFYIFHVYMANACAVHIHFLRFGFGLVLWCYFCCRRMPSLILCLSSSFIHSVSIRVPISFILPILRSVFPLKLHHRLIQLLVCRCLSLCVCVCSVHAFSRDIENDFIFLSALKSKRYCVCPALPTDLGDCTFVADYSHYIWIRFMHNPSGFAPVHCYRVPCTFGIYYNLKHDPLFWHAKKNEEAAKERKKGNDREKTTEREREREKRDEEIKQDRKCTRVLYDVQSVYMLCMSNTQIFYYYQL